MSKKKIVNYTPGKMIRLAVFILLTALGFFMNAHVKGFGTFGWGFGFGLAGMAILLG